MNATVLTSIGICHAPAPELVVAVDAFGDLVHVLEPEVVGGGPEVEPLHGSRPPARRLARSGGEGWVFVDCEPEAANETGRGAGRAATDEEHQP